MVPHSNLVQHKQIKWVWPLLRTFLLRLINIYENENPRVLYLQTAILHGSIHSPTITTKNASRRASRYNYIYLLTIFRDKGRQEQFTSALDSVFERADALALTGLAEGQ